MPQSGVPESFKVLVKELQSLGLDIKVLNKYQEVIDLSQTFEDDDMGMAPADNEAFRTVTDENELEGFGVEEIDESEFEGDDLFPSEFLSFGDDDDEE